MITVTGATGHLGRLAIDLLQERGVPADQIVAAVRTPAKAADLAARGVQVREADYTRPETLRTALAGTTKLLMISTDLEHVSRIPLHENVVRAAAGAGVDLIFYTSAIQAGTAGHPLAVEHKATEEIIAASGLPYVFLRNGWYFENYTENLGPALEHQAILGAAGEGRISGATRADYAAAAAAVLTTEVIAGTTFELGGDTPFTMAELAAEVSAASGRQVAYTDLPAGEYVQALTGFGLPERVATILAESDLGIGRGEMVTDSSHLRELIGRPTTPLADAVATALKELSNS